jgi:hypothetical protein
MTSDRETITLQGLSPSTLYFADRPQREVGHMPSRQFVTNWPDQWKLPSWDGVGAPGGVSQGQSPARGAPDPAPRAAPP